MKCFIILATLWLCFGLGFVGGQGLEKKSDTDPFSELPDTKLITVEYKFPYSFGGDMPAEEDSEKPRKSAQDVLESYGVSFPEGTSADIDRVRGVLVVTHTVKVFERIDEIIESILGGPQKQVFFELRILEMSREEAERVEELTKPDFKHDKAFQAAMELVETGKARIIAATSVIGRFGQRSKSETGEEVMTVEGFDWNETTGLLVPRFSARQCGLKLELDPVISGDDLSIDLSCALEYHYRAPVSDVMKISLGSGKEQEFAIHRFFVDRVASQQTFLTGSTLLLGRFTDRSPEDPSAKTLLDRLAFLTGTVQMAESTNRRRVIEDAPAK
ncbi:MAG: hypothetical protein KDM63_15365, partial [Verrucomicrobiae bacterium]|nr:hypothetical protein [Verrucomicrobiae bacterium]